MLSGGLPQIFVSDMDRAVKFYTEVLGMKLEYRFGNHWASLRTGDLAIGLHPESAENPAGRKGFTPRGLQRLRLDTTRSCRISSRTVS
jgi:catechol 2,3-dioxygenase-like lactoylglutathione lyase family enzyme